MRTLFIQGTGEIIIGNLTKDPSGIKEIENIRNKKWGVTGNSPAQAEDILAGRCKVVNNRVVLAPESEWPEVIL